MSIDTKIALREKKLKSIAPIANDNMKKKTNSELHLNAYEIHKNFTRFICAALSFLLYMPTIIELFQNSFTSISYFRNIILVLLLILIEVTLSYSLYQYYISKFSQNAEDKVMKRLAFTVAFTSIILSSFSGLNAVSLTTNGTEGAISTSRAEKKEDLKDFNKQVFRNDNLIAKNSRVVEQNNKLIADLKAVSVTKKGSSQINSYLARNKELSAQNKALLDENKKTKSEIKKITNNSNLLMKERIGNAGKKEIIYMIIFFFIGIISVIGLFFSYNFMGKYQRYLSEDISEIEVLEELFEENLQKDIATKSRKNKALKKVELDNIDLDNELSEKKSDQNNPLKKK